MRALSTVALAGQVEELDLSSEVKKNCKLRINLLCSNV
jgi:hypothetical protein